jgi:hypothetical protein
LIQFIKKFGRRENRWIEGGKLFKTKIYQAVEENEEVEFINPEDYKEIIAKEYESTKWLINLEFF